MYMKTYWLYTNARASLSLSLSLSFFLLTSTLFSHLISRRQIYKLFVHEYKYTTNSTQLY